MIIKRFKTQRAAMSYAHQYLVKERIVGIRKKDKMWEVRILARRQR